MVKSFPIRFVRSLCTLIVVISATARLTAVHAADSTDVHGIDRNARTLTFRIPSEPETLDWNRAHTTVETYILMNIMEGLLDFDDQLRPHAALAKSWNIDATRRIYTFTLRKDAKWSDGKALRAEDFVFSWKRLLSPLTASSSAYLMFDVDGAKEFHAGTLTDFGKVGIRALNDETLQVRLTKPVANWIYIPTFWATFPLREDIVSRYGEGWATPGRMVTLGAFTLVSHDFGVDYVFRANPTYYQKHGNLAQIVARIVSDDSEALRLYDSGQIDLLTQFSAPDMKKIAGRSDLKNFRYLKTGYLGFQTKIYPSDNAHFRRAVAMSIDRSQIPTLLQGGQTPAQSFVSPGVLGYSADAGLPYSPAKARAEFALTGYDPATVSFKLLIPDWEKEQTLANFIQSEVKRNLGVTVQIEKREHKNFWLMLDLKQFHSFLLSWGADFPDPDSFMSIFLGDSGANRFGFANAAYEKLVLGARGAQDLHERKVDYMSAQKILLEQEAVAVPLYYEMNRALVRDGFNGVNLNPLNYLILRDVSYIKK